MSTTTHVFVKSANPYLICDECDQPVTSWHDPEWCGCGGTGVQSQPCGHQADMVSVCPSWNPGDGCQCQEDLGYVPHAEIARGQQPAGEQR